MTQRTEKERVRWMVDGRCEGEGRFGGEPRRKPSTVLGMQTMAYSSPTPLGSLLQGLHDRLSCH